MLSKIVEFSLNHRLAVIAMLFAVLGGGILVGFKLPAVSYTHLDVYKRQGL